MASHDTIGDFLTIIRNASSAQKDTCSASYSKIRENIASILKDEGYVADYSVEGEKAAKKITVVLRYLDGVSAITGIDRVSKPGNRVYCEYRNMPKVLGGLGISILSTSQGVLKNTDCVAKKAGGEIICKVW